MVSRGRVEIVLVSAITGLLMFSSLGCGGNRSASLPGPAWGAAALIETSNAGDAGGPRVAMNNGGSAVAVWPQSDGAQIHIWANSYVAGAWGTAAPIENNPAGDATPPQVAMDNAGNAVAVWQQSDGTRNNIWASRYSAGVGWDPLPVTLTDNTGADADFPHVAMDGAGNAVAVWKQTDGTLWSIWSNRYTPGSGWSAALQISNNTGDADNPRVAEDGGGNALAVWNQNDGGRQNIWSNRYTAGGNWAPLPRVVSDNTGDASIPRLAMNETGNAVAVWEQFDGALNHIWANRFVAGGGWGTATVIESDNTSSAGQVSVGMDAAGNAVAVWSQSDGMQVNIWGNRYTAGSGWGTEIPVETDNSGDADLPQVAMNDNGTAMAVWQQSDGTVTHIRANRYVPGSGWGVVALVETDTMADSDIPRVGMDAAGHAVAVWQQFDGTRWNISANVFR